MFVDSVDQKKGLCVAFLGNLLEVLIRFLSFFPLFYGRGINQATFDKTVFGVQEGGGDNALFLLVFGVTLQLVVPHRRDHVFIFEADPDVAQGVEEGGLDLHVGFSRVHEFERFIKTPFVSICSLSKL